LPPAIAAGALAAIRHLKQSQAERERRQERAARLKHCLTEAGLPVMPSPSHIVPVMVGDPGLCKIASEPLHRHRIYVRPINYPTVPRGSECLRLTPSPLHSDEDIEPLVAALRDVWGRLTLRRAARFSPASARSGRGEAIQRGRYSNRSVTSLTENDLQLTYPTSHKDIANVGGGDGHAISESCDTIPGFRVWRNAEKIHRLPPAQQG
jgi:hypothetical protein